MFLFPRLPCFHGAPKCPAIRSRSHAVDPSKVVYEVTVRTNAHPFQNLLHREKRRAQHYLSLSQAIIFEVLSRTDSRFLFKEMAEARWRQTNEFGESFSVPRGRGFGFYLRDDEFYSSIHSDEAGETKSGRESTR